jgi:tRNA-5-taurinomethyluridine 2-sulfurtransferase
MMETMNIAVLVSGGVDSSVALQLLRDQGHAVTAFYLKIWLEDELSYLADCPWQEDLSYVQSVCDQLGVPLEVVGLQQEYHEYVVKYTIEQVKLGNTPNPDMLCNKLIKFGFFMARYGHAYDKVATGHYAQVTHMGNGQVSLRCAPDPIKDQTYFLSQLSQAQLQKILFPIGHLHKAQVRSLALQYNLPNKTRKDSQGICFLGNFKFRDFVRAYAGEALGDLVELETGNKMGTHNGFWFYTIGQRQGLGLSGGPWFVVRKDIHTNTIFISRDYYDTHKQRNRCLVRHCNWINDVDRGITMLRVKLRHGPQLHDCLVFYQADGSIEVRLMHQDQGIAPGQFAVFYNGDTCLGGGVIVAWDALNLNP